MNTSAHARTLKAINASLFGEAIDPEQMYDGPIPPEAKAQWEASQREPTRAEVIGNVIRAKSWHLTKYMNVSDEINQRQSKPNQNAALIDDALRALAYHRSEIDRCTALLDELGE